MSGPPSQILVINISCISLYDAAQYEPKPGLWRMYVKGSFNTTDYSFQLWDMVLLQGHENSPNAMQRALQ